MTSFTKIHIEFAGNYSQVKAQGTDKLCGPISCAQGISLPAPAPISGTELPNMDLVDRMCVATDQSGSCVSERLQISLSFPKFGFYGAMNFTGDMLGWSFTNKTWPAKVSQTERIVRFTGGEGSETWRIWVSAHHDCRRLHVLSLNEFT